MHYNAWNQYRFANKEVQIGWQKAHATLWSTHLSRARLTVPSSHTIELKDSGACGHPSLATLVHKCIQT